MRLLGPAGHGDPSGGGLDQACDRPQHGGLPRPGLPDQAERGALGDAEGHVSHRVHGIAPLPEDDVEPLDVEDRRRRPGQAHADGPSRQAGSRSRTASSATGRSIRGNERRSPCV